MTQIIDEDTQRIVNAAIKVAIYTRVSTDIQEEDGTSLETQIENCLALAKAKGYIVVAIFREVFTGSVYRERIELSKMRTMYREGDIQGVLFNTFDRLGRNQVHLGVLIEEMQHYNIFIECVKEKYDSTPTGRFLQDALAFAAEVEYEKLLERTDDGRRKKAKSGKLLGSGEPRYGYSWSEDRTAYIINEQEAVIVKRIYAMALQGVSIHTIASTLTQEGIPARGNRGKNGTRRGKGVWLHSTIHRILSWPGYSDGEAYVYVTHQQKVNGKRLTTMRPEEDQIKVSGMAIPLLVDKEVSEKVKLRLQENKIRSSRNNQHPEDTLLRCGLVVCGYCNRNGVVTRKKNNKIDYRCKSSGDRERGVCEGFIILARILDQAAWEHAIEIIKNPALVEQKLQDKRRQNPTDDEFAPVNRRLKEIEKEMQNLITMGQYSQSDETVKTFGKVLAQLEREKIGLFEEKKKLQNLDATYKDEQEIIAGFDKTCGIYRQRLEDPNTPFTYAEKREVLEYFGIKAFVWRVSHKPRFKIVSSVPRLASPLS